MTTKHCVDMMLGVDPTRCRWCGEVPELYMVRDEIWCMAFPEYGALRKEVALRHQPGTPKRLWVLACFVCLQSRLGRDLRLDDFTDAPVNGGIRLGYRLGRRDGALGEAP